MITSLIPQDLHTTCFIVGGVLLHLYSARHTSWIVMLTMPAVFILFRGFAES